MSPHAVEKQAFFHEESPRTRPGQGPIRCPASRPSQTLKRFGGSSRPGRLVPACSRGIPSLTTAVTLTYFTKRSVAGGFFFGKMAWLGHFSLPIPSPATLPSDKRFYRVLSDVTRWRLNCRR